VTGSAATCAVTEWVESPHANLLFSPLLQATFGVEYLHARWEREEFSAIYTF